MQMVTTRLAGPRAPQVNSYAYGLVRALDLGIVLPNDQVSREQSRREREGKG